MGSRMAGEKERERERERKQRSRKKKSMRKKTTDQVN
jgi:hypothetical protein